MFQITEIGKSGESHTIELTEFECNRLFSHTKIYKIAAVFNRYSTHQLYRCKEIQRGAFERLSFVVSSFG